MKLSASRSCEGIRLSPCFDTPVTKELFGCLGVGVSFDESVSRTTLVYSKKALTKESAAAAAQMCGYIPDTVRILPLEISEEISRKSLRHNVIDVSPQLAAEYGLMNNQAAVAAVSDPVRLIECTVSVSPKITEKNEVRIPPYLRKSIGENERLFLFLPDLLLCTKIKYQLASAIKDDTITVDTETYERLRSLGASYVTLRHLSTGSTITRPFSELQGSGTMAKGEIRLNYQQRESLNIFDKRKVSIKSNYISTLKDKVTRTDLDAEALFGTIDKKVLPSGEYNTVQLFPQFYSDKCASPLPLRICDFLAGGCSMRLSAVRPYKIDDARNIIRLSEDSMTLLGIQETNSVIIRYKNRSCKAFAMKIDSFNLMKETNILDSEDDLDIIVGIPAPLRDKLDIGDIETEVTIVRDTPFLFRKNLNIQLLSVLGLLLAVFQIGDGHILIKSLICVVMLPVIILISLSQERSKVANSKKKRHGHL